mmetsp:Transcript_22898/g.50896  ORF Transcript_22898/g.50896 Transcript_22898/m.50896 type:complete len:128 (-) Transcript_22898:181-564(-)|eukprot:CAMPEP_0173191166 /NCGR_PEP_ID=MMETSP1141-20130122/12740_1 /TAXON_ID=483371 /ORGANISM="non described non described, Strain CCMP2298" /LENGTH=127 /DNA_ID=CAMNT_0014115337 /DNA_START=183 /DNA_END=566 /DNA_ORIENTATION=-
MDDKVKIVFDKEYKIRALDPVKFEKGEALEKECSKFVEKISSFNEKVNTLVDILDLHASRIDAQKLRAIGLRIAVENEADQRGRMERALQTMAKEKRGELDRHTLQLQSLERIGSEQRALLEKITNS